MPVLNHITYWHTGRSLDFYLLKAAGATTADTPQWSLQGDDLSAHVIKNPQGKRPRSPKAISGAAISILRCKVNPLPKAVLNFVFVICFKTCYDFQNLNLLMNQYLIYLT